MMKWILIPLALMLSACDPTPPPQPETERKPNPVFETQIQSMEKARAVEGQVMDAAEAQRKQIDEAAQ
jgi:starvation-inducible outer membrane lipoprotein